MQTAKNFAGYLLILACNNDEPDPLTHLRLQKLLYYIQGWSLGLRGVPAFSEKIEAWAHGPVLPELYQQFKNFGNRLIPEDVACEFELKDDDRKFAAEIWETYKDCSASKLRSMTHAEPPWKKVREGYGPEEKCEAEITVQSMKEYFSKQAVET